jgi:hypothetical protein
MKPEELLMRNPHCVSYKPAIKWDYIKGTHQLVDPLPDYLLQRAIRDLKAIEEAKAERDKIRTMQLGDYLYRIDGTLARVTRLASEGRIQDSEVGSHHLFSSGHSNFSGGLDDLRNGPFKLLDYKKDAEFWMFSQKDAKADNGFYFDIPVRVWTEMF